MTFLVHAVYTGYIVTPYTSLEALLFSPPNKEVFILYLS